QLKAAIKELQDQGFAVPNYPDEPKNDEEKTIQGRYDKIKGSAVNPVLREGNSDRRAPQAVKQYARNNPHSMGKWSADSKTHVASMGGCDFYGSEKSVTMPAADSVKVKLHGESSEITALKETLKLLEGEIIYAYTLSVKALRESLM